MPLISRIMIRIALGYLVTGVILGVLLLVNKAYAFYPPIWALLPVHIELLIFGWIIQLTLGVAYWILPRFLEGKNRGNKQLAWGMALFLNLGILVMIITYLDILPEWGMLTGRLFEVISVVIFAALHWNRIVSYNK